METNDVKDIWKTGVEENIQSYSEEELNEMVVKSARKSIKAIYPGIIFRFVIIAIIVYISSTLISGKHSAERMLIDLGALMILSVSYFFWERSAFKMRKYTNGMPIKEWLEYRIKEVEKCITYRVKYNWIVFSCSFLLAIVFYVLYQIEANVTPNILNIIVIPIGIFIYLLIVARSLNRNYRKTIRELKDLYKQFEDSNE
ncbi:MAG: hypothetical protein RRZ65_03730 [Tannerellaceae bacterium]